MRVQALLGVLLVILLGLVYTQYKLNRSLSNQLSETKQELKYLQENIKNSVIKQNEITERVNNIQQQSYQNNQQLKTRLNKIPTMKVEERKQVLDTEYINILDCIEKTTLGEVNVKNNC